jgi:hypothetical protein
MPVQAVNAFWREDTGMMNSDSLLHMIKGGMLGGMKAEENREFSTFKASDIDDVTITHLVQQNEYPSTFGGGLEARKATHVKLQARCVIRGVGAQYDWVTMFQNFSESEKTDFYEQNRLAANVEMKSLNLPFDMAHMSVQSLQQGFMQNEPPKVEIAARAANTVRMSGIMVVTLSVPAILNKSDPPDWQSERAVKKAVQQGLTHAFFQMQRTGDYRQVANLKLPKNAMIEFGNMQIVTAPPSDSVASAFAVAANPNDPIVNLKVPWMIEPNDEFPMEDMLAWMKIHNENGVAKKAERGPDLRMRTFANFEAAERMGQYLTFQVFPRVRYVVMGTSFALTDGGDTNMVASQLGGGFVMALDFKNDYESGQSRAKPFVVTSTSLQEGKGKTIIQAALSKTLNECRIGAKNQAAFALPAFNPTNVNILSLQVTEVRGSTTTTTTTTTLAVIGAGGDDDAAADAATTTEAPTTTAAPAAGATTTTAAPSGDGTGATTAAPTADDSAVVDDKPKWHFIAVEFELGIKSKYAEWGEMFNLDPTVNRGLITDRDMDEFVWGTTETRVDNDTGDDIPPTMAMPMRQYYTKVLEWEIDQGFKQEKDSLGFSANLRQLEDKSSSMTNMKELGYDDNIQRQLGYSSTAVPSGNSTLYEVEDEEEQSFRATLSAEKHAIARNLSEQGRNMTGTADAYETSQTGGVSARVNIPMDIPDGVTKEDIAKDEKLKEALQKSIAASLEGVHYSEIQVDDISLP